jgi:hypothetical protein
MLRAFACRTTPRWSASMTWMRLLHDPTRLVLREFGGAPLRWRGLWDGEVTDRAMTPMAATARGVRIQREAEQERDGPRWTKEYEETTNVDQEEG